MLSRFTLLKQLPAGFITGLVAGATVGLTRVHPELAPLQVPALAILGWDLMREKGFFGSLRPGFWFGVSLAAVALSKIRVDLPSTAILFVALTGYWTLLGSGISRCLRKQNFAGVWAAAGLLALGEWAQIYVLPLFGTAQRIAAAWVDTPLVLLFSRVGGTTLVAFVIALTAFTLSRLIHDRGARERLRHPASAALVLAPIAIVLAGVVWGCLLNLKKNAVTVTVAVCGGKDSGSAFLPPKTFERKFGGMVAEAAERGAKFIVTPELALNVEPGERDAVLARLAEFARKLGVVWVLGFSEGDRANSASYNRAVLLNAGMPVGEIYDKTHWVSFMESYARHGDAGAVTGDFKTSAGVVKAGVMICQDDNFENVAGSLSRAGSSLVGVPTYDWPGVAHAHLDSARNRPREGGFIEARAAVAGISAIIAPDGRILASRNHLTDGDGIVTAEVSVGGGGPTVFAALGDWPTLAFASAGLLCGLLPRKKQAIPPAPAAE